jgi:hypothetical protein
MSRHWLLTAPSHQHYTTRSAQQAAHKLKNSCMPEQMNVHTVAAAQLMCTVLPLLQLHRQYAAAAAAGGGGGDVAQQSSSELLSSAGGMSSIHSSSSQSLACTA